MKWFGRSLIALVLVAGVFLYFNSRQKPAEPPVVAASPESSPSLEPEPSPSASPSEAHYLVPTDSTSSQALPSLNESDPGIVAELKKLIGKEKADSIFNLNHIIRRIVVCVENASKHAQLSQEFSPFKPLETSFRVAGKNKELAISPKNFERYSPYVELARTIDTEKIANFYTHFYPLFQSAYEELGVKGYFNDHVIAAMDVIINSPETEEPISLVRGPVHPVYKFADERLEALPAMQKIMIRMGTENAKIIKAKFKELREEFTHLNQP